jgi:hypothetical protein
MVYLYYHVACKISVISNYSDHTSLQTLSIIIFFYFVSDTYHEDSVLILIWKSLLLS